MYCQASLTEAPLKMTGGDCHDTLMPFSLPNPASSAHTGILTGAVAWNMHNHHSRARKGSNKGKDGENRTGKHRKLINPKRGKEGFSILAQRRKVVWTVDYRTARNTTIFLFL